MKTTKKIFAAVLAVMMIALNAKEPPPTSAVPLRLRLDQGALASCTSYDQLLEAARDTNERTYVPNSD